MANVILKKSEDANINYLAIISKVSALKPIENADKLCTTVLNGYDIIVQKTTQIGDIVVFFPMETAICEKFLSANNQYGISDYEKNARSGFDKWSSGDYNSMTQDEKKAVNDYLKWSNEN